MWKGFDLVGHEDPLNPLTYYMRPLRTFVERQKELGLEIPFIFHAGETLGDGTPADMNLYDAILLGTKRIGHGYVAHVLHLSLFAILMERQLLPRKASQDYGAMPRTPDRGRSLPHLVRRRLL